MHCRKKLSLFAVLLFVPLFLLFQQRPVHAAAPEISAHPGLYANLMAFGSPLIGRDYLMEHAALTAGETGEDDPPSQNFHTISGYATLALVAATAVSSSEEDLHESLGYAAAAMATLTCVSGFKEYGDYFDSEEGFSEYNVHIAGAAAGTAGFILTAILGADDKDHSALGGISAAAMIIPVISLKW